MGYTHYWTPKPTTPEQWTKFVKKVEKLHKALPKEVVLASGNGDGEPVFSPQMIDVNGKGVESYETFRLKANGKDWVFCKTAYRPYDLFVCAVLVLAHQDLGYSVSSDGDNADWAAAYAFLRSQKIKTTIPQHQ